MATVMMLLMHCDESLPPRTDPQNFLAASVSTAPIPVIVNFPDSVIGGIIRVELANLLDEVLESDSSILVTIEVHPRGHPEKVATLIAGRADLFNPEIVHGRFVTLRPDSPAVFMKRWSQRTDDGTPMWEFGTLTLQYTRSGIPFCADSVYVVARASVKLFNHVAPVQSPDTELVFDYRVFGIGC